MTKVGLRRGMGSIRNLTGAVRRFSRVVCLCREAHRKRSVGVPLLRGPAEGHLCFSVLPLCEGFVYIRRAAHLEVANPSGQSRGQTTIEQQRATATFFILSHTYLAR